VQVEGSQLVAITSPTRTERSPVLRLLPGRRDRAERRTREQEWTAVAPSAPETPHVDIAPNDPCLAFFQGNPEPTDLDTLKLDSPGVRALRDAGIKLVVPLVTQGELIGLLNLGPRLSEQEYSADDRKLLENLAGQAAPALRVAQLVREQEAEIRRRERYEQELQVAQLIQQNFLPRELPQHAGWSLDAFYRPAREVGGDFYDVFDLPDGRLAIVVGDVTDKGVPAALVMASTRSVLRASAQRLQQPGLVLERVNDQLAGDMPPNMFVTCLYGVLEPDDGRFVFANAGHNLPAVQGRDGAREVKATGMPLGLIPGMSYDEAEFVLQPGESALLYSDAIPEAHDRAGDMFGFPRVLEVVGAAAPTARMIDRVLDELHRFTGPDWVQEDDVTLVTLRRTGTLHPAPGAGTAPPVDATTLAEGRASDGRVLADFSVPSRPGSEREVAGRVVDAVAELDLPAARRDALETAVAEATMNAIEHGNLNDATLHVEVRVFVAEHALVVRVTDQGLGGGVPDDVETPDIEAKLRGEQSPRGWGLFLMRSMVDDLRVHADDHGHVLELVVRLDGDADG
jgi:serine phosphatase RsbU (regulator of sigma subunit)/anti-sigma regulatory factor (Ser/Thr protein kinase)